MPTREEIETALVNADRAGDKEAARQLANALKYEQYDQDRGALESVAGVGEVAATMATGVVAEPVSGLAGIMGTLLPGDPGQGARFVESVRKAMTYQPRTVAGREYIAGVAEAEPVQAVARGLGAAEEGLGEIGAEVYGAVGLDPALGYAAYSAIPTALLEATGLGVPGRAGRGFTRRAARLEDVAGAERAALEALTAERPIRGAVEEVAEQITEAPERVAEIAKFDPSIVKAAQDLGFDEIPPSVAAGNAQFRDIAQGMASISGSQAKAQYGQFLEGLANKADELIVEGGGDIDKAALSARYFDETENVIKQLSKSESDLYKDIERAVTPSQKVPVSKLRAYVDEKVAEFGSVKELPKPIKDIHGIVYKKTGMPKTPTYASFSQKRREVGQALSNKSGPYGDAESTSLKDLYGALKTQQRTIVEGAGVRDIQDAADAITIKRNAIQDTKVDILGRDLSKDLMPEVAAKIRALPKGNVTKFKELIEGVPKNMRQEVVVSALNDIMRGTGADQRRLGAARFVGFMADLNSSPTAKAALYKYVPKKTQKSLDNLNKLATGVYKANKESITTGKIAQFFPENRGFLGRLMGAGRDLFVGGAGVTAGRIGAEAAEAVTDSVNEFMSGTTKRAQTANEFIASPQLQELMKRAVRDGVVEGGVITERTKRLEKVLAKSKRYKKWADTLSGSESAKLASMGLSSYLFSPDIRQGEDQQRDRPAVVEGAQE